MHDETSREFDPAFDILHPVRLAAPLMYNSPHSGTVFPSSFLASSRLGVSELKQSSDLFVDDLLTGAANRGVPLMRAHFPRSFLDVNREPYELDPKMFEGRLPDHANTTSQRVTNGYGTIARLVAESQPIYPGRISVGEALRRIDHYYLPYHQALAGMLDEIRRQFGHAVLIDWHSMPSLAVAGSRPVDIVLGDRNGASCSAGLMHHAHHLFEAVGLTVQRNQPYAGGFITEHYGTRSGGIEALQIEINRALYMDEVRQETHSGFVQLCDALMLVTDGLIAFETASWSYAAAAE